MNKFRKLALLLQFIGLTIFLIGCVISPSINFDIPAEKVASVQFYDLLEKLIGKYCEIN